jgi:hypothetical protein
MGGGQLDGVAAALGQPGDDRLVAACGVDRVGHELGVGVRLGAGRPARAAVAPPVEGDHPEVAGQVGDLGLPAPRVHDRPGRQQQQQGRRPGAEQLVEDLDAVALDVAVPVGQARPHAQPSLCASSVSSQASTAASRW